MIFVPVLFILLDLLVNDLLALFDFVFQRVLLVVSAPLDGLSDRLSRRLVGRSHLFKRVDSFLVEGVVSIFPQFHISLQRFDLLLQFFELEILSFLIR